MNVNDFVILPGSKTGMSVKLKAKSVQELQLEKVQLELDNQEMERKLQQLQSNMSREKLERERANGYHWKSGQAALGLQPQLSQNKENTAKISSGKVKLRVLKEHAQEPSKQFVAHRVASAASTEKPKVKGKPCGQCETKTALLVCLDCGEDYCPSCFARVHQKGALKLHRTTCLQKRFLAFFPLLQFKDASPLMPADSPPTLLLFVIRILNKHLREALEWPGTDPSSYPGETIEKPNNQEIVRDVSVHLQCNPKESYTTLSLSDSVDLEMCNSTSGGTAKPHIPVGKLQAAQRFLKNTYPDDSNGEINYEQKKEVNLSEDPSDISSPLPEIPTDDVEEVSTVPTGVKCQTGGSLLHGTFNEEESAKHFQEALNQWRSGNSPRKHTEERCCQSEPENTETCEAQTSPPVMKKTMEFQFEEDSLKYMEKLWLKKYKRTPLDKLPDVLEEELKPTKSLINEANDTWVEEEEDDEVADSYLAAEDMKKYWADVRKEEPEAVPVNLESSLKIEILEDACKEEAKEFTSFVIMEAGSEEVDDYSCTMLESHKTEPDIFLAQAANIPIRSPLSSSVDKENDLTFLHTKHKETPRASSPAQLERTDALCDPSGTEEVSSIPCERVTRKEKPCVAKKNHSCTSPGHFSSPLELAPCEPSPVMESLEDCKRALEPKGASPVTTNCSELLQEVALKEKPICTPYRGLEGFFAMSTISQEVMADLFPSPSTGRPTPITGVSFSGSSQWVRDFSFSECADEDVVQDVLNLELGRPSSRLGRQSPSARAALLLSPSEKAILRPFSANKPCCRTAAEDRPRPSSAFQRRPKSSPTAPLSRAASEISEIEGIDVTARDDPFLEDSIDRQALADLGIELQNNADLREELSGILSDSPAFNRHSKVTSHSRTASHKNHEIKGYSKSDTIRVDDGQTDDEEDLWQDKQRVMELR